MCRILIRKAERPALERSRPPTDAAAVVNTLVLAYAGAALPVLLIFSSSDTGFGEAVNREPVAEEVVATLVGSIGLMAAVPLTTALAALLATRIPVGALGGDAHAGHGH